MTLSGILGYTLAAGTYLSIFSHGALRQLMNEGVYWTKTVTFTIDSSFEIIESIIGFIWIAFGISGWANKYNSPELKTQEEMILDIFFLVSFIVAIFVNLDRIISGGVNIWLYNNSYAQQNTSQDGWAMIRYHDLDFYWNNESIFL
jgi:hypothetical protein